MLGQEGTKFFRYLKLPGKVITDFLKTKVRLEPFRNPS